MQLLYNLMHTFSCGCWHQNKTENTQNSNEKDRSNVIVKYIVSEIFLPKIKESAVCKNINLVMKE